MASSPHPASAHSALAQAMFWAKSRLLIARRLVVNAAAGELGRRRYRRLAAIPAGAVLLAEDESRLYSLADPRERALELGKVQNLRIAAAAIDGIVLAPGETFGFWRAAGRATRGKGYVIGRELRQGCVIPTIGGGLCQLTNALSRIAHRAGMEIVERHSHSVHPEGFFIDGSTDATVFWNYVDFRFRSGAAAGIGAVRIGAVLDEARLIVRLDAV